MGNNNKAFLARLYISVICKFYKCVCVCVCVQKVLGAQSSVTGPCDAVRDAALIPLRSATGVLPPACFCLSENTEMVYRMISWVGPPEKGRTPNGYPEYHNNIQNTDTHKHRRKKTEYTVEEKTDDRNGYLRE